MASSITPIPAIRTELTHFGACAVARQGAQGAVSPSRAHETLIAIVRTGQFTGEVNTLSGRESGGFN